MSRNFTYASSQYLQASSAIVTGSEFAISAWFRATDITQLHAIFEIGVSGSTNNNWRLMARGDAGDILGFAARTTTSSNATTTNTYSANTWHHAAGICATSTDRRVLLDNDTGGKGTDSTSKAPSGVDVTTIGHLENFTSYFDGDIAEVAVWDTSVLPGAAAGNRADYWEAVYLPALASGVSPIMLPLGLLGYWPLYGSISPEPSVLGGYGMVLTNSPIAGEHAPGIIYPSRISIPGAVSAAPPGTNPKNPFGLALAGPMSRGVL